MAIKSYKPTTPGRRFTTTPGFEEITKSKPEKALTCPVRSTGGRNNHGRMTSAPVPGGHPAVIIPTARAPDRTRQRLLRLALSYLLKPRGGSEPASRCRWFIALDRHESSSASLRQLLGRVKKLYPVSRSQFHYCLLDLLCTPLMHAPPLGLGLYRDGVDSNHRDIEYLFYCSPDLGLTGIRVHMKGVFVLLTHLKALL